MRTIIACMLLALLGVPAYAQERLPVIDMHLHAHTLGMYGTPPPAHLIRDVRHDPLWHVTARRAVRW